MTDEALDALLAADRDAVDALLADLERNQPDLDAILASSAEALDRLLRDLSSPVHGTEQTAGVTGTPGTVTADPLGTPGTGGTE